MSWIERIFSRSKPLAVDEKAKIPDGIWTKCEMCNQVLYRPELEKNLEVCPKCQHHMRITARRRLIIFLDDGQYQEIGSSLMPEDKLKFRDSKRYRDRLLAAQKVTGENDACVVLQGKLMNRPLVAIAFEFNFMGGSMGAVVGERFVLGVKAAMNLRAPLVCFSSSGGARMQEGLFSLMQMGKVSAALNYFQKQRLPYISVLTNPTMGGVSASLAMLGDINIAEPKALIGFAGPRVIEQTVREKLPVGFQRSEFLLSKGMIDMIVSRLQMRERIGRVLSQLTYHQPQ